MRRTLQIKNIIHDLITLSDEELDKISNVTFKFGENSTAKKQEEIGQENQRMIKIESDLSYFEEDKRRQLEKKNDAYLNECLFKCFLIKQILDVIADRRKNGLKTKLFSQDEVTPIQTIQVYSRRRDFKKPARAH